MTPFERLLQFLITTPPDPWIIIKVLFLFGLLLYVGFAVIVIRQVGMMSQALNGAFNLPLRLISWIHLWLAIAIFLLALIVL